MGITDVFRRKPSLEDMTPEEKEFARAEMERDSERAMMERAAMEAERAKRESEKMAMENERAKMEEYRAQKEREAYDTEARARIDQKAIERGTALAKKQYGPTHIDIFKGNVQKIGRRVLPGTMEVGKKVVTSGFQSYNKYAAKGGGKASQEQTVFIDKQGKPHVIKGNIRVIGDESRAEPSYDKRPFGGGFFRGGFSNVNSAFSNAMREDFARMNNPMGVRGSINPNQEFAWHKAMRWGKKKK